MPAPEHPPVVVNKVDVFRRALLYILVGLVAFSTVLNTFTNLTVRDIVGRVRETQVTNTAIGRNTNATSKQVKQLLFQFQDCIDPHGDCAQKGAEQTQKAIQQLTSSLQRIVILQGACQHRVIDPADPNQIATCVAHLLNNPQGR